MIRFLKAINNQKNMRGMYVPGEEVGNGLTRIGAMA